jgi:putative endonuclease
MKQPAVYIMANKPNGTIYVGVTSDLVKRAYLHRNGLLDGFTKKYDCKSLVFFEIHQTMESAILREKQLKAGSRQRKIKLIELKNSSWIDLYPQITADKSNRVFVKKPVAYQDPIIPSSPDSLL